jgi:hypothetical protein
MPLSTKTSLVASSVAVQGAHGALVKAAVYQVLGSGVGESDGGRSGKGSGGGDAHNGRRMWPSAYFCRTKAGFVIILVVSLEYPRLLQTGEDFSFSASR